METKDESGYLGEMMQIGRELCAQELNITRIVASSRSTALMHGLVSRKLMAKALKRSVPENRTKMGTKYVGPNVRKMRFKAEQAFAPTPMNGAGFAASTPIHPRSRNFSMFNRSDIDMSLYHIKEEMDGESSFRDGEDPNQSGRALLKSTFKAGSSELIKAMPELDESAVNENNQSKVIYVLPEIVVEQEQEESERFAPVEKAKRKAEQTRKTLDDDEQYVEEYRSYRNPLVRDSVSHDSKQSVEVAAEPNRLVLWEEEEYEEAEEVSVRSDEFQDDQALTPNIGGAREEQPSLNGS